MQARELKCDDFPQIRAMDERALQADLGEKRSALSPAQRSEALRSEEHICFYSESGYSFVVEIEGQVVGFVLAQEARFVSHGDRVVYIEHIEVDPEFREHGVGLLLYRLVIEKARSSGANAVVAGMDPDNQAAIHLHQRLGFELVDWKRAVLNLR